jgi:YbbR domain-containing protein
MAIAGFHHLGLKVVSIALAALLWLIVSGEQIVERAMRVPLEFTNLPAQLELVGDPPTVADVRIRGSSGALSRVAAGELVAVVDLRTARPGQRLFHLAPSDVRSPFGIDVVQITPSNVSMRFEPSAVKAIPIVPGVEGEPAPGFVVGTVVADPPTVEVLGPASALSGLTEAITEPVSVAGASKTVTESVTVGSPDPMVRLRQPLTTRVTVSITAAPVEWDIRDVAVQVRNAARPVQMVTKQVNVRVRGPSESRNHKAADFDASVDVAGLGPGQYELPVRIVPPSRVGVITVTPAQVKVRVR